MEAPYRNIVGRNDLALDATGWSLATQEGQESDLSLRQRPTILCPSHRVSLLQRYQSCALRIWNCRLHGKDVLHVFIDNLQSPHGLLMSARLEDKINGKNHIYHHCNNLKSQVIVLNFLYGSVLVLKTQSRCLIMRLSPLPTQVRMGACCHHISRFSHAQKVQSSSKWLDLDLK